MVDAQEKGECVLSASTRLFGSPSPNSAIRSMFMLIVLPQLGNPAYSQEDH